MAVQVAKHTIDHILLFKMRYCLQICLADLSNTPNPKKQLFPLKASYKYCHTSISLSDFFSLLKRFGGRVGVSYTSFELGKIKSALTQLVFSLAQLILPWGRMVFPRGEMNGTGAKFTFPHAQMICACAQTSFPWGGVRKVDAIAF